MNKLELLQEELRNYGKVAIAYSGGVDSNFLFHVALETLGKENVLPVLCRGAMMSKEDIEVTLGDKVLRYGSLVLLLIINHPMPVWLLVLTTIQSLL